MDARNEFMFSPSESKGMKERLGPAISKVFSPSQFIHAQKKKSFYKALSGLSFHESGSKDRRVSTKIEGAKFNPIYMSKSENNHENNHSRKFSHESYLSRDVSKQREGLASPRTRQKSASLVAENLPINSLRLMKGIGGYDNVKSSFGSYDNIKKPHQNGVQHISKNSNERQKSRSHSVNHSIACSENINNDLNKRKEYPVRPDRMKGNSQIRRNGTIIAPDAMAFQNKFEKDESQSTSDFMGMAKLTEKYEQNFIDNLNELKYVDKEFRSRSRGKSEKSCEPPSRSTKSNHSIVNSNPLASKKSFKDDMNRKISLGGTENSNRIKSYSRQFSEETNARNSGERRARLRSKSVITPNREPFHLHDQSNKKINDQPPRPTRARSSSRSKSSIVSNVFNKQNQFNSGIHPISNQNKYESEAVDPDDSGMEDNDSCNRARSRKKSEIVKTSNGMRRRSRYLNDQGKHDSSHSDENDGGYYSLEKEENITDETKLPYQLPPAAKIPNHEYYQNDHSVDALYITQAFMDINNSNLNPGDKSNSNKNSFCDDYQTISHILGEDIYDNCQRSALDSDTSPMIADNDNYHITQTVEETEIYEIPVDSKTPEDNEDLYETIEFANYEQVNNPNMTQSLPIVDDSDEEGDYMDIKDFPPMKPETKVTVITIKNSDAEVREKALPTSQIPIRTPANSRHNGYFNPYVGKKLSQPNNCDIYDNVIKPTKLNNNSYYDSDSNSMSHSYPVSKAVIPKLPERNKFMSRSESVKTPNRQSRPPLPNQNNANRYNADNGSSKKTSIGNQKSNGFEFISETNYKVDNLDYTFKLNFSQLPKGSAQMDYIPKETSHTNFICNENSKAGVVRKTSFRSQTSKVTLSPNQVHVFGDLLQPLTFQELLRDKHLNPPENEAVLDTKFCDTLRTSSLSYPESQAQKQLDSLYQNTLNMKRTLQRELSNQSFSDNISVCWSEADSEFEFMNVTK